MKRREQKKLNGGKNLRLLSAMEILEARREAEGLTQDGRERALCANACLVARVLYRGRRPAYKNGMEVLRHLNAEQISALAGMWWEWSRSLRASAREGEKAVQARKKALSTRRMSAFTGACCERFRRCLLNRGQER